MRTLRVIEFIALFIGLPSLFYAMLMSGVRPPFILTLIGITIVCLAYLLLDRSFQRRELWAATLSRAHVGRICLVFIALAGGIAVCVALFEPDELFSFVRRAPQVWIFVMILYPVFSVYPQELVYRTFLFHRYRDVFRSEWAMIAASAVAFGYMHIIFNNWLAVAMTTIGGALFAYTYSRTRSTMLATFEHALYGCFVFTVGLGRYFFGGAAWGRRGGAQEAEAALPAGADTAAAALAAVSEWAVLVGG